MTPADPRRGGFETRPYPERKANPRRHSHPLGQSDPVCHSDPFCHSERSEESQTFALGRRERRAAPSVIPAKAGIQSGRTERRVPSARRRLIALTLAALAILALPTAAAAHGGSLVFSGDRGPYQIRAFAILNEGWLDYSIDLRELGSGERVTDAQVSIMALTPDGLLGPWGALYTGTVYEMIERAPEDVDWTIQVDVTGSPGSITYAHRLRITPGTWIGPTVAVAAVFALAVVAHAYTGRKRRARAKSRQERAAAR